MNVKRAVENQISIFNNLKQAKLHNRLSHAYLFYGDEGVGKKEMAYALACLLYCPNDGCLECETCKSILSGNHMNVDYIGVDETKTMISKDQITALQDEFSKTSLVEGSRIYIVDGIDTASAAAQNSLLKFIEEPINSTPTIGIFLASELSNVVTTIISRCALQHFKAVPMAKSIGMLTEGGIDQLDASLLMSLTNNIDEALSIVQTEDFKRIKDLFIEFISLRKKKDGVVYFIDNASYFSNPKNLSILLKWILLFIEDSYMVQSNPDGLILAPLYDKIIMNNKDYNSLKDKLEITLDLSNRLRYNVSAKNVFHELIAKLI
ncbi:MAG: hypothetical protein E7176_00055 [Erysipelotrichaceae bacterium]|nr:hypothetical protein [Erysipelotrichaceae bacterium]